MLFKTVCDEYHLIPEENYTVPPEAEGLAAMKEEGPEAKSLLRKQDNDTKIANEEGEEKTTLSTGATTRRHKQTPNIGPSFTTIQEGDEDDRDPESPTKEEQEALASSVERISLPPAPMPEDASVTRISQATEKKEPIPVAAEPTAHSTNEVAVEQKAAESTEPKQEEEDEKRPSTAVSDKKWPSVESAATMVKTDDSEKAPEEITG